MHKSLDEADKPAKWGKKGDQRNGEKEGQSSKVATPKKTKSEKASSSAPKRRKVKKMDKKLKTPSNSDSDYVHSNQV